MLTFVILKLAFTVPAPWLQNLQVSMGVSSVPLTNALALFFLPMMDGY